MSFAGAIARIGAQIAAFAMVSHLAAHALQPAMPRTAATAMIELLALSWCGQSAPPAPESGGNQRGRHDGGAPNDAASCHAATLRKRGAAMDEGAHA